jgi:L-threonylcarbamoyladenylate synthase
MGASDVVHELIEAIGAGLPVLLPTDTVYGLAATVHSEAAANRLYRLKGREPSQPTALLAGDLDALLGCLPELAGRAETIARALLPGPYTLILPNPARRFPWLGGPRPDVLGVRVPVLPAAVRSVLAGAGCVLATSANEPGGADPATIEDVPERIRSGCAASLDLGRLPGAPSTVIDFTGEEPRVLREGAAPSSEALARVRAALPQTG